MSRANGLNWESETERVTFRLPRPLLEEFEAGVERGHYPNRSEAFRDALRAFVREQRGGGV